MMNRKRWTKILMGAVCGVMLTIVSTTGWTRTAFICEGRIGNAATNPGSALGGDFEFDISTNTAAPAVMMQFAWSNGVPVEASIRYDASSHWVIFTINGERSITNAVDPTIFDDPNGLGFLNFRNRAVNLGSSVELTDMEINIDGDVDAAGQANWIDLDPLGPTVGDDEDLGAEHGLLLQQGFTLKYKITFRWATSNPPGRSRLAVQIGANEYPKVASVTLKEVDPDTNQDVDPVAADSSSGNLKMGNPESHGGGLMFFAEKNTPTGSVHNKLKAVAKLTEPVPPGTTVTVHFKIFDMDDPTQDYITTGTPRVNIVDPNDMNATTFGGGDNYRFRDGSGFAALPTLSADSVTLNTGEDTASITFEIPEIDRRPGNNWKVVAHTDLAYLNDVEVDDSATSKGLGFRLNSNPTIFVPVEFQTELVSLWRTIWMEFDTMDVPPVEDVFYTVAGLRADRAATTLTAGAANQLNWTKNSLNGGVLDSNAWPVGITLALGLFEVAANNDDTLTIRSREYRKDGFDNDGNASIDDPLDEIKMVPAGPTGLTAIDFSVNTDDAQWLAGHLSPPAINIVISTMNQYYNATYVRCLPLPVTLNTTPTVPFVRMTDKMEGKVDVPGDRDFWTACIVWAYEAEDGKTVIDKKAGPCANEFYWGDDDPEDEGVLPGNSGSTWGMTKQSGINLIAALGDQSMIYVEMYRDKPFNAGGPVPDIKPIGFVVAHEIGHQFGLHHAKYQGAFTPDLDGIMRWERNPAIHPCAKAWKVIEDAHVMPDAFSLKDVKNLRRRATDLDF